MTGRGLCAIVTGMMQRVLKTQFGRKRLTLRTTSTRS